MPLTKVSLLDDPLAMSYAANVSGNVSVTRSLSVGYTDGRVPQANVDVKGNVYIDGNTHVRDQQILSFGTGKDLQIYHNGSHSYISEEGTGQLYLRTNYLSITNAAGSETMTFFDDDGAVNLYYDGVAKLATTGTGLNVTGIGANVAGNASVTRSLAVGYTDGRVPQANLDVKGNTHNSGLTTTGTLLATSNTYATAQGSITLDFSTTQNFVLTFTGDVTFANPTTEKVGQAGIFVITQGASGGPYTLALGTDYETAGTGGITLSTGANDVDIIPYFVKASGAIMLGAVQKDFG